MDLPFIRPIIYGCDTRLINPQSFKSVNGLAFALTKYLRTLRKSVSGAVIFLAHSLGGIVLKRAVVNIANSGTGEVQFLSKIRMIFFFGVPNQGMHHQHLLAMVEGQPNQPLVESLSSEAAYLPELDIQFSGLAVFRTIRFISIYETRKSLTTKEVEPGKWVRSEPYEILVQRASAIQRGTLQLDSIPIDEDHSNLVKFAENDQAYKNISARIEEDQSLRLAANAFQLDTAVPSNAATNQEHDLERLLESLDLAETNKRQAEIERAYANTFGWVYENPHLNIISWLREDDPIFWIRGKPGSGKSTLMKYLLDSEQTSTYAKARHAKAKIISCWFFFYARGSFIQKSFEGLLHSILHQVVREEPRLARIILPLYLNRSETEALRGSSVSAIWPLEDLVAAFDLIIKQDAFHIRLYLFLDALDEYDGRPELVTDFLRSITNPHPNSRTQVKICFSSRPWNVFINSFNDCPGFSIHEYTKQDIWMYTESELSAQYTAHIVRGSSSEPDMADLQGLCMTETVARESIDRVITELTIAVVEKARGVFLWVRLVLKEFLKSAVDGATLDELHGILSTMPEELEEFYDMILRKIDQSYLLESYIMMDILLRSDRILDLAEFGGILACSSPTSIKECMGHLQMRLRRPKTVDRHALKLKIESRCGGLVEVIENEERPTTVHFMHQTVKEFVSKPEFKQRILGISGRSTKENGHSILAKYYTSAASTHTIYGATVSLGMFHARLSESTTGFSQATFLNSVDAAVFSSWVDRELAHSEYRPKTMLALAVTADLRLYVLEELERRPIFLNMQPEMSLLHSIVQHTMVNQEQQSGHPKVNPNESLGPMCSILLKLGVSFHSEYRRSTPFESLFEQYWRSFSAGSITSPSQAMFDVAQALLSAGQDPDVEIYKSPSKEGKFCKPLHILHSRFIALLLQHRASVNTLDSNVRTALDLSIAHSDMRKPLFGITDEHESAEPSVRDDALERRRADEAFETTMLLVENGGCITSYGANRLRKFLSALEKFYPIPEKFRTIPYLPTRIWDRQPPIPEKFRTIPSLPATTVDHLPPIPEKFRTTPSISATTGNQLQRIRPLSSSPRLLQPSFPTSQVPHAVGAGTDEKSKERQSPSSKLHRVADDNLPLKSILKVKTSHVRSKTMSDIPDPILSTQKYTPKHHYGRTDSASKACKRRESILELRDLAMDTAESRPQENQAPSDEVCKNGSTTIQVDEDIARYPAKVDAIAEHPPRDPTEYHASDSAYPSEGIVSGHSSDIDHASTGALHRLP